ncbi:MAG: aldehyde ferredoxin oxidoreductase N-terminal domain-containing protein [Candidatus Nezhaarchaeales archaeon]
MFGYAGWILFVDLSEGRVQRRALSEDAAKGFIGGLGVNVKLAYDLIKPGTHPLEPDNPIIMGAGPLIATPAIGAVKVAATTKLPATGTVATGTAGGYFGYALKRAGYDHLVVTGRAENPTYLEVVDGEADLKDARHLIGLDAYQTVNALKGKREAGGSVRSVVSIGKAGERLLSWSICLVDNVSHLGRGGMGAVMGSKNLKAVVVQGSGSIPLAHPDRVESLTKELAARARAKLGFIRNLTRFGVWIGLENWAKAGMVTRRNFREARSEEEVEKLCSREEFLKLKVKSVGCPKCPGPCKGLFKVNGGEVALPEPLNVAICFTARLDDCPLKEGVKLLYEATRHGIDCLNLAGLLDFLAELSEKGLVEEAKLGFKPELTVKAVLELVNLLIERRGIGRAAAEGWTAILKEVGVEAGRYAVEFKGLSPIFEARANFGAESFGHLVNPRGHEGPVQLTVIPGRSADELRRYLARVGCSREEVEGVFAGGRFNVALYTKHVEDWKYLLDCLGLCRRESIVVFYDAETCAKLYSAVTGFEADVRRLKNSAERVWLLERLINVREGFTRSNDKAPKRWFEPLTFNGLKLGLSDYFKTVQVSRSDIEKLLSDYYAARGCDIETGVPLKESLLKLGLNVELNVPTYISSGV